MLFMVDRKTWVLIFIGLFLRVGYASYVHFNGIGDPAVDGYETIARQLVDHGRYDFREGQPTALREPGFPFFIAAVYAVFGKRPFVLLIFQALLGIFTALLIRNLARKAFGPPAGGVAFVLAVFYPYFIFYTAYFYRETFLSFILAVLGAAAYRLWEWPRLLTACVVGLLSGLCAVTVSTYAPVGLGVCVWAMWRVRRESKARLLSAALAMGLAVFPALWIARNYAVFHRFIPGGTLAGVLFYEVLIVPADSRGTPRETSIKINDPTWQRLMSLDTGTDDGTQLSAAMRACLSYIKDHPGRYLRRIPETGFKLWRLYPYERSYQHDYRLVRAVSLLCDGWLIPLGFLGLFLFWGRTGFMSLILVILSTATLTHALSSAIMRYRLPLMGFVIILAAGVLTRLAESWKKSSYFRGERT